MKSEKCFVLDRVHADYLEGKLLFPPEPPLVGQFKVGGFLGVAIALIIGCLAAWGWYNTYPLLKDGQVTQGTYLGLTQPYNQYKKNQEVAYCFKTPDGKTMTAKDLVRRSFVINRPDQEPILIRYLPQNPEKSVFEEEFNKQQLPSMVNATVGFLGLLLLAAWGLGNSWRLQRNHRLLRIGAQMLEGEILEAQGARDRLGFLVTIKVRFTPLVGAPIVGKGKAYRKQTQLPEPGTPVKVLYHSRRNYLIL